MYGRTGHIKFKGLPYYWGAIATTKCIKAILFAFLLGKNRDKNTLDACTRSVRHMGNFMKTELTQMHWVSS